MLIHNARQQVRPASGVHHWLGNQRLLLQCEYLIAESRVLRSHVTGRLRLPDTERSTRAEIAKRLGPEISGGSGLRCLTGYDLGLVSSSDCLQVRRLEAIVLIRDAHALILRSRRSWYA